MAFLIALVAFLASLLTLFSGFGLGTLLTPVFALFFPLPMAIALTGIVHLLNNLFKVGLLGKKAAWPYVLRFGLPSVIGGFFGAWLLLRLNGLPVLHRWYWNGREMEITPLKLVIAFVLAFFALMEIVPALKYLRFSSRHLFAGGLASGFFGGLSGNQGALRSAFLINTGLSKEQFIATGVVIACLVDLTRLPVYFSRFAGEGLLRQWPILLTATLAAFAGAWLGTRFLKKITLKTVQWLTTAMILGVALALALGLL